MKILLIFKTLAWAKQYNSYYRESLFRIYLNFISREVEKFDGKNRL
jgi:hypothetical protein